jgi:hypothetical protein
MTFEALFGKKFHEFEYPPNVELESPN